MESLQFRTAGRDQAFLHRFVGEVVASHHKRAAMSSSLYLYDDYWVLYSGILASATRLGNSET